MFAYIKFCPEFKTMLGYFLGISNILNANDKKKCQADGFELTTLNKVHLFKGNDGVTMLQYVMNLMTIADPAFPKRLREDISTTFKKRAKLETGHSPIDAFKSLVKSRHAECKVNEALFQEILDSGDQDPFVTHFTQDLILKK